MLAATANSPRMGRKKLWAENVNLTLPAGAKARMDAFLAEGEDRLDLIRVAIDREIIRRQRKQGRPAEDYDQSSPE